MRVRLLPALVTLVQVAGICTEKNKQRITALEADLAIGRLQAATLIENEHLRLIVEADRVVGFTFHLDRSRRRPGTRKLIALRLDRALVHIAQRDGATVAAFFIGSHAKHQHVCWLRSKVFALVVYPTRLVADAVRCLVDIELAAVSGGVALTGKLNLKIPEGLVSPCVLFIADPERVLVKLDVLVLHPTVNHAAQMPVTNRQAVLLPLLCGGVIPEHL